MPEIGFLIKKGLSILLMPSGIIFICLFTGLFIWPLRRRRALALNLFFLGFLTYWASSCIVVSDLLVGRLEEIAEGHVKQPDHPLEKVVVLCGGMYSPSSNRPILDREKPATRMRLLRTIQLLRQNKSINTLIIAGGPAWNNALSGMPEAQLAYMWLQEVRLPRDIKVILEKHSRDTEENLEYVKALVGTHPFYLVTSAMHIPRVMLLARHLGLKPYPVPCDFRVFNKEVSFWWIIWPHPENLVKTEYAIHEYLGIVWTWLKYQALDLIHRTPS